jgi:dimethylargininase
MLFSRALVRAPGISFAGGLSSASEGPPDVALALRQHASYVAALRGCGMDIIRVDPDEAYPDGTFVEDTAILTGRGAILTRPGAPSRAGEVASVRESLQRCYTNLLRIVDPGTVDGGDICEADGHFLIGLSSRTNDSGAAQLATHFNNMGYTSSVVDIRSSGALLHLKSGVAYLGDGLWVVDAGIQQAIRMHPSISARDLICVSPTEAYAANCVRVNDSVLTAAGFPQLATALRGRGCHVIELDMSEFKKMDGGLSCLSLRF